jgi:uncharacterized protein YjiS (DUF1127 family)
MAALIAPAIVHLQHEVHVIGNGARDGANDPKDEASKMAYSTATRGAHIGLADRIAAFFTALRDSRQRYRMYRQTVLELSVLSDRELHDLGLHRSSIDSIALEAAYGK